MFSAADHDFMARALRLARRGLTSTTPNPRVGCVIVMDGTVVGEGWHRRAGEPHAEVYALQAAGASARGATVYVTLEPCSHHGRTPPCANALIDAGVTRVVAAMRDPNPQVCGRGLSALTATGIVTQCGLMETEAGELNIGFVSRVTRGRPWVRLKLAASLDGKTALNNGVSQWITGPAARRDGHRWRARACAILSGIGTVRADDPRLSVRDVATERQPLKVVVDARLELPTHARVLAEGTVLVACAVADGANADALRRRGAELVYLPDGDGRVNLAALLTELGRRGVNELHVESGYRLSGALLRAGLVDELLLYLAPCLLGDAARGMFDLPELTSLDDQRRLKIRELRRIGDDLRVLARIIQSSVSR
ncbi:MAG: bifunctional diaminohydroxyphosphoribosylaminopyrimidine deaminase/5-amino-6-(5-phosphoribosylamino)uracil reductase RibD [Candidatus Accumulibacter sp.]|jgi:diaminohydroxyphosphoribosylaminopyrimidine deaminase/5-amino-6-(5-phosphoribosylamino)uracil reductase|nr:bifunctional diaminohydroxyphosphoribosylaminopyrimidine deaminase/5-amino-6-(5-phosphoribosylamino)uracil reductase RibD [Accumulibacter sp.]